MNPTRARFEKIGCEHLGQVFGVEGWDQPGIGGRTFSSIATRSQEDRQYWTRMLGTAASLLEGGKRHRIRVGNSERDLQEHYVALLSRIYDPDDPIFVGYPDYPMDQRIVELACELIALAENPGTFWNHLPERCRQAVVEMAERGLDHFTLSINNWNLFAVVTQASLKKLGLPWDRPATESLLTEIDQMYKGEGWYSDGYYRQFDYYVPKEMHAFGLVAGEWLDIPEWRDRSRERARLFAECFDGWFDHQGRHVPYGRSLCYRYAASSFWSIAAWLGVPGLDRGDLIQKAALNIEASRNLGALGIMEIGLAYDLPLLAEPYICAGSAGGGFSFKILSIPAEDPAWTGGRGFENDLDRIESVPNLHLQRSNEDGHAVFFNQGSMHPFDFGNHPAKYGKFAYSTRFGFNLSSPAFSSSDNMLSLSRDGRQWSHRFHFQALPSKGEWLLSRHRPFPDDSETTVTTALAVRGPWHVRLHRIDTPRSVNVREGGFAVDVAMSDGELLPSDPGSVFIRGKNGLSGIVGLLGEWKAEGGTFLPNVNVFSRKVQVPHLTSTAEPGGHWFAATVYASAKLDMPESIPQFLPQPDGGSVRWPDGTTSTAVAFGEFPEFTIPGTQGKPWSRPAR